MKRDEKTRRIRERLELTIPVRVRGFDGVDCEWAEMSRLVDVTPFGARLKVTRPTERGRLLQVISSMPRSLRCFDHAEEQYRVWCLVRNVKLLPQSGASDFLLEAGVAFVGKFPPRSFAKDPAQRFEIANVRQATGLYELTEDSDDLVVAVPESDKRRLSRHTIPFEVLIDVFVNGNESPMQEKTVTENVSRSGASVFTSLNIDKGRFVKMTSEHQGVSMVAAVRSRRLGPDGIPRLHLEFVGGEWPLGGME